MSQENKIPRWKLNAKKEPSQIPFNIIGARLAAKVFTGYSQQKLGTDKLKIVEKDNFGTALK